MNSALSTLSAPSIPDLDSMTKTQLLVFAEQNNIEGLNDRMLKADMIQAIKEGLL